MPTPSPTPIADTSHHILTVLTSAPIPAFPPNAPAFSMAKQIDVRKVVSWTYYTEDAGTTWHVKLSIPGILRAAVVPDAGPEGTGWRATKTASLTAGG